MSNDDDDGFISAVEAAELLKVSARQIRRYQEDGTLSKAVRGKCLRSEVEAFAAQQGYDTAGEASSFHTDTVLKSYSQAVKHVETMFQLTMQAHEKVLSYYQKQLDASAQREEMLTTKTLETMTVLGDLLMQKDEREAMAAESRAKVETMGKVAQVAIAELPTLLRQFGGSGSVEPLQRFAAGLDEEQRGAIAGMYWAFEGEQREQFGSVLSLLKLEVPPDPNAIPWPEPEVSEGEST